MNDSQSTRSNSLRKNGFVKEKIHWTGEEASHWLGGASNRTTER